MEPSVDSTATMDEPKTHPIPVIDTTVVETTVVYASENVSDVPTPSAEGRPTRARARPAAATATIPADAYWGVHTARAVENFPITGLPDRASIPT